ncbi:DNA integration/recombination/inversion protein [Granulibacter bethesdensis]|nr:DNA integration/recombination/inversion protein [Granulibacter bethesdensis]
MNRSQSADADLNRRVSRLRGMYRTAYSHIGTTRNHGVSRAARWCVREGSIGKACGYLSPFSTVDQACERQKDALKQFAERVGYEV